MANDQGIGYGARPYNYPHISNLLWLRAETGATLDIFRGQFVFINSRGNAQVTAAGASVSAMGIAWEFSGINSNLSTGAPASAQNSFTQGAYLPRNTDGMVGVLYDPDQLYVMEEATGGTAININSIGLGASFTYIASTGNTTTGLANSVISQTVIGDTTALLQIVGLYNINNQDGTLNQPGASAKWIVRVSRHQFGNFSLSQPQS